ncbi:acyl-CoA dehydratase activase [Planctomycetota bacterium]
MSDGAYILGIDVGSVTLKLALMDGDDALIYSSYEKHHSHPLPVLLSSLERLRDETDVRIFSSIAVTGSGRSLVSEWLEIPAVNEIVSQSIAVSRFCPGVRTILEIGGQDSKFIQLGEADASGEAAMLTQKMNDICAAGTGAFVEQQAERMDIPIEEFGDRALESKKPAFVAGRCAVFAKTDIIHLRQEGVPQADIAAGICGAVVRNYMAQFSQGARFETPIVFQGGLAANKGVVKAFRDALGISGDDFRVPEHFDVMAAMGTALMSREYSGRDYPKLEAILGTLNTRLKGHRPEESTLSTLPRLVKNTNRLRVFTGTSLSGREQAWVGIDVGSTSTCVAVLNDDDRLLARTYTLNRGNVIESVNAALAGIRELLGDRLDEIEIMGAGVTGSGRYLVSQYVGADVVKDEISAQARAAVHMMPDADTVFEIGGQDSKYIRLSEGRVVDFEMNKVCAAGTGSFLQEQAARLHEEIGDLSDIAFGSHHPVDLGSRCTVFMESDLVNYQQMGFPKADLIAGLSYSVARNYLEKVVAGRPVGDTILLLGGVAFNDSVVSAFQQILQKDLIVPDHHDTSAAIGMALIAREDLAAGDGYRTGFRGFVSRDETYELSSFQCKDCANTCRINVVTTNDATFRFGGACGKHEKKRKPSVVPNLFEERERMLMGYHRPGTDGERVGIPRAHLFFEFFPLWCTFLQELGYEVVVSDATNKEIVNAGMERSAIDNCVASKIVYGHVHDLVEKGALRIFYPSVIEFERRVEDLEHNYRCPHIQAMSYLVGSTFPSIEVISPVFVRDRDDDEWRSGLHEAGLRMGRDGAAVTRAIEHAVRAQADFRFRCEQMGRRFLKERVGEPSFVVMGKVYNACDPGLNLNIAEKLRGLDVHAIPYDCLPLSEQILPVNYLDVVWSSAQDLIRAARVVVEHENVYPILVTNFCCTPDSFAIKYLDELFKDRSFLVLEMDEHTSDVGIVTRIEAFLNNIRAARRNSFEKLSSIFKPFIGSKKLKRMDRLMYVPVSFHSYRPMAAAFESIGIRTKLLPPNDKETERLGRMYSSGKECVPYIMYAGDAVKMTQDPEFDPDRSALYIPSSNLACRVSLFPTSIRKVLNDLGYPQVPVIAPRISSDKDEVLEFFGVKFEHNIYRGILASELLARRVTEVRPYEKLSGAADDAFEQGMTELCGSISSNGNFLGALREAVERFDRIDVDMSEPRPVVGLIGDDYSRANPFANNDFIREIERLGGEVWTVSVLSRFVDFQMALKARKMLKQRRYWELLWDLGKLGIMEYYTRKMRGLFGGRLKCFPDPSFSEMIEMSSTYLDERTEPLVLICLTHVLQLMKHGAAGIANLIGFQCAEYSILSAALKPVYAAHGNLPVLNLFLDFQERIHQKNRIEAFMHQVRQYHDRRTGGRPARTSERVHAEESLPAAECAAKDARL